MAIASASNPLQQFGLRIFLQCFPAFLLSAGFQTRLADFQRENKSIADYLLLARGTAAAAGTPVGPATAETQAILGHAGRCDGRDVCGNEPIAIRPSRGGGGARRSRR